MLYSDNLNVTRCSLQGVDENNHVMNDHKSPCGDAPPTVLVTAPPNQGKSKIFTINYINDTIYLLLLIIYQQIM